MSNVLIFECYLKKQKKIQFSDILKTKFGSQIVKLCPMINVQYSKTIKKSSFQTLFSLKMTLHEWIDTGKKYWK